MKIEGKEVVSLHSHRATRPVISDGSGLDFVQDLLNGELDQEKDYQLGPVGVVGVQLGAVRYWATLDDGSEHELDRTEYERLRDADR